MERLDRQVHTRRNHPAKIITIVIDNIKSCGCAEIKHHQRPAKQFMGGNRVDKAVSADLAWAVHDDFHVQIDRRITDNHRFDIEITSTQGLEAEFRSRNHGGDNRPRNRILGHARQAKEMMQPYSQFVCGPFRRGRTAPLTFDGFTIKPQQRRCWCSRRQSQAT